MMYMQILQGKMREAVFSGENSREFSLVIPATFRCKTPDAMLEYQQGAMIKK